MSCKKKLLFGYLLEIVEIKTFPSSEVTARWANDSQASPLLPAQYHTVGEHYCSKVWSHLACLGQAFR
jgi:hypothetical protein